MEIKRTGGAGDPSPLAPQEADSQTQDVSSRGIAEGIDEISTEHSHGTLESSLVTDKGDIFSVFDSAGGYYGGNKVKIVQDPTPPDDGATTSRRTDDGDDKP
jgi:hypothetical protein